MKSKHIMTFEKFSNLGTEDQVDEKLLGNIKRAFTQNYNDVISEYVEDIESGKLEKVSKLKKELSKFYSSKPGVGAGSKTKDWENSVKPLSDFLDNPKSNDVPKDLENLIAKVILKDARVKKDSEGVWKQGAWSGTKGHTFGSGN